MIAQWIVPRVFEAFQFCIGGTVAKRNLVLRHYAKQKRVLEVGCSVGNIAASFIGQGVDYVGVDIDAGAISYAKTKFQNNDAFAFLCGDLRTQKFEGEFDYIVLSAVVHHMDDATTRGVLEFAKGILSPKGVILVSDPIQPRPGDGAVIKAYRKMERGMHVRTMPELSDLMTSARGLRVVQQECLPVAALPLFAKPVVSYFALFLLEHAPAQGQS